VSWFSPQPKVAPVSLPRRMPKRIVPSYIGEANQVLNLLMHRGSGDVARDYSGEGNHGTIHGAEWIDEYSALWVLDFVSADANYVEVPHDDSLYPSGKVSILAWVRPEASVDFQGVVIKGDDGAETYEMLLGDQAIYWAAVIDGTRNSGNWSFSYSTNEWMLLAMTYETGGSVIAYKNASTIGSASLDAGTFDTHTVYLGIGREPGRADRYLDGQTGKCSSPRRPYPQQQRDKSEV